MTTLTIVGLVILLLVLIGMSAYFSSSETAMMALNRYRLRHLAENGHGGANRAQQLLARPDRLIGVILLGNNFVNILATQIATILALHYLGADGLIITTIALTIVILIFAEVLPKTVAALDPERIAFPSTRLLKPLLWVLYPLVWMVNGVSNGILNWFDINPQRAGTDPLDREELRTVVKEAGAMIPSKHRQMLFGILDLEHASVEDIMVPRAEIDAIDLEDEWTDVVNQIVASRHTRVPCYRGTLDSVVGVLHVRSLTRLLRSVEEFRIEDLEAMLREVYFVPTKTNLHKQLINFQRRRERLALAVDEYGDIEGLVTIDDLLEEVVGEFTTDPAELRARCVSAGRRHLPGRWQYKRARTQSCASLAFTRARPENPERPDPRGARRHSGNRHKFAHRRLHSRNRAQHRTPRQERPDYAAGSPDRRASRR